ncbi:hypothetical protein RO3G_15747 [Rhizopus delemar RA 99-880]|uniref:Optic atrophy 3-like protein n=1 Tax=Rhizopus delemar (strain RA 99-880 / ATCC MYA-4621 / FGSC 9543 / NRRL 43880) TaxID=246409 RepID=I1CRF6_RHIO9|nr:hypothetical protein RO3G_15747 [Rhizopus delemar RA 99-880]|eukprot:EIE91036.1 hypothetical protein RO3G_15747 [Rhizopus delemar RA 99-880]
MTLKMKFLGYKTEKIRPLNDTRAIEAGANFLSEAFIFSVAASIIIAETWRSHSNAKNRRNHVDDALENLENKTQVLSVSMGLKRHTEYQQQPTVVALPGISVN